MFHGRNLRKHRISSLENVYSVTSCVNKRNPLLKDIFLSRTLINAFKYHDDNSITQTYAFVVMPDHFHWFFQLKSSNLDSVIQRIKSFTAHRYKGTLWQQGYYEHNVRAEEDVRKLSRYIVANPLRAGLVEKIEDYPHWDAVWLTGEM